MPRVLLTGCGSPASQNLLRSVRRAPESLYIVGADANRYHLEWGDLDAAYEAPLTGEPGYLEFLNHLCEAEGIDFLHGGEAVQTIEPAYDQDAHRIANSRRQSLRRE